MKLGEEADEIVAKGLKQELLTHPPDGHTFYLIDCGSPHHSALVLALLDYKIDPSIYTNPSEQTLRANPGHYNRYRYSYEKLVDEIFRKRMNLGEEKGLALLVDSHAEKDERARIDKILPSVEFLRDLGITKVVLGKEFFYAHGAPHPSNPTWEEFFNASKINLYVKQLWEAGFEVVVMGFDYRQKKELGRKLPTNCIDQKKLKYMTP